MVFWAYFTVLLGFFSYAVCNPDTGKLCKEDDVQCYTNILEDGAVFKTAIAGDDKLGIQPLDPLHQELIEVEQPNLKYTLRDTIVNGLKGIIIHEIKLMPPNTLRFDISFPYYEFKGNYELEGKLINFDAEGQGKFYLNATNFHVHIDTKKEYVENDGIKYLKLTPVKTESEILGTMYFDLGNLFHGDKERADPILKFINENQRALLDLQLHAPIDLATMKNLFKNINKILANTSLDENV